MAHVATSSATEPPPWSLDSGASHNITADLNNLTLHAPYNSPYDIVIDDGTGLHITHSGTTSLSTPSNSFTLHNILCAPHMKRNIISISQFCKTNKTSVKFLPSSFRVKDLQTGAILLHSCTKDDIYEWLTKSSSPIIVFSSVKATPSDWHHRLGHPSEHILWHLISNYKLHLTSALLPLFHCKDYYCNKSHKLPFSQFTLVSFAYLQIIFSDVWTSPIMSIDNFKYYVIFINHFTQYIWLYPLKRK